MAGERRRYGPQAKQRCWQSLSRLPSHLTATYVQRRFPLHPSSSTLLRGVTSKRRTPDLDFASRGYRPGQPSMNSRERFLAALYGEQPDRTPVGHVAVLTTRQLQQATGCYSPGCAVSPDCPNGNLRSLAESVAQYDSGGNRAVNRADRCNLSTRSTPGKERKHDRDGTNLVAVSKYDGTSRGDRGRGVVRAASFVAQYFSWSHSYWHPMRTAPPRQIGHFLLLTTALRGGMAA